MATVSFIVKTDSEENSLAHNEITDAVGETLRDLEASGHVIDWRIEVDNRG